MSNKCDFCGEGDRKNEIDNPNCDKPYFWYVCDFCKNYIKEKQDETMKMIIKDHIQKMKARQDDAISEEKEGCGLAFDEKPIGDRANGKRGKLCVKGQLCKKCQDLKSEEVVKC